MSVMRRCLLIAIGVAALAAYSGKAVAQSINQQISSGSVIEEIKKRGVIRVGLSTFVPWAMRSKKGDLVGFEIDVANQIGKDMGVKVEFVPTAWDGIIPALVAGKFDIIISGLTMTPQRNLTVNFTIPYAHSGQQMTASKKLAGNFKNLEDFNNANVTITCRRATPNCVAIKEFFPKATLRQFDDEQQTVQEVLNGNAHATMTSSPKPKFWTLQNPELLFMPTEKNLTTRDLAMALRKGDPDALNFFNNWITVRQSDGWLAKRHAYWFDAREWADQVEQN